MLGQFVDFSGIGQFLKRVEITQRRRLKTRFGWVSVWNDRVDKHANGTEVAVNPLRNMYLLSLEHSHSSK